MSVWCCPINEAPLKYVCAGDDVPLSAGPSALNQEDKPVEKFTPDQLKNMLTDEARAALPPNVEFGQTADGKLTIDGKVIPYCELKQRDNAWYEERAKLWIANDPNEGVRECALWEKNSEPQDVWYGCYIPSKDRVIYFGPKITEKHWSQITAEVARVFQTGDICVGSHQSRDIREAIDAQGPWEDEVEKIGTDGDTGMIGATGPVGPRGYYGAPPSGTDPVPLGEPKGPVGVRGDGSCSEPSKSETVKPETIDAIVSMYEERLLAERIQNDMGAQENRRLIEAQAAQIQDLTARMQRVRDALDGKTEKKATDPVTDRDPFDADHQQMVEDASMNHCSVFPSQKEIRSEMEAIAEIHDPAYMTNQFGRGGLVPPWPMK